MVRVMAIPNASLMADPKFVAMMIEAANIQEDNFQRFPDFLPKPPKFRHPREISARRKRKLEKRGEYCQFVRWTVNGKCRYSWGGKPSITVNFRFGPWQSPKYQPPAITTYALETHYTLGDAK
jgi:hypothetical protein